MTDLKSADERDDDFKKCRICFIENDTPQVVVGRGNPLARLMVVGEAPGALEDALGLPFVGRSGKVLDELMNSVGLDSEKDAFICNVIKCRPPNNRKPTKAEVLCSIPWLYQQIELVDPWVIALTGATAVESILGIKGGITHLRGEWQHWKGRLVMPLFHPSYLLRNPSKAEGAPISLTREDFFKVRNQLEMFKKVL